MSDDLVKVQNSKILDSSISMDRLQFIEEAEGIDISSVDFRYGHENILQNFSEFIPKGKMTCLIGANGAGKTTLLKLIAQLITPTAGQITYRGFTSKIPTISYFRQFHELDRHFPLKVIDIVGLSHIDLTPWRFSFHPPRHENCLKNLELLGIGHLKNCFLSELSQGQIQRVYLARFLAENSEVLLLDEPFNFIDHKTQVEMLGILKGLQNKGKTIVTILHQNPAANLPFDHKIFIGPKS